MLMMVRPPYHALPLGSSTDFGLVAFMHVKALDSDIPAGTYIANSEGYPGAGTVWQDAMQIVAKNYPKAVANEIFPNDGVQETRKGRVDARRSEELFGIKFLTFEDQVKSVANHFLQLAGEEVA